MAMVRKAMLPDFACREITEFSAPPNTGSFLLLAGKGRGVFCQSERKKNISNTDGRVSKEGICVHMHKRVSV